MTGGIKSRDGGRDAATGRRYRVRVIQAGLSLNGNYYPDMTLRAAVPLFEGSRVFVKADQDHLRGGGKDVRNLIGRLTNPAFQPGDRMDSGEITADLELIDPNGPVGRLVFEAYGRGMSDLFGLSIDAEGVSRPATINGRPVRIATDIRAVRSVDLIVEPGAGGRVIDLLEAAGTERDTRIMDRDKIIELLRKQRPDLLEGVKAETLSDADLLKLLGDAVATGNGDGGKAGSGKEGAMREASADARELARRYGAMRDQVNRSGLPPGAKKRLIEEFEGMGTFTEAHVSTRIGAELVDYGVTARGGRVTGLGGSAVVELVEGRDEKVSKMLDALFDPNDSSVISIRECYVDITGDRRFTGMVRNCDPVRLREALGSQSFGEVLGDAVNRRLIQEYRTEDVYDVWKFMVFPFNVSDFREQKITRVGGYGDLPEVGESQPYLELVSPTDDQATYAVKKRGGTESVSLEMIANDDMRIVGRLPERLAQAAKRTLSRFVLDIPRTNPVIYDGMALFHQDHGNLGTAALSSAAVAAGRLAVKKQRRRTPSRS